MRFGVSMPLVGPSQTGLILQQVELPAKPMRNRHDGPINVADQAVAKNDVGDFPVSAFPGIGPHGQSGNGGGFTPGLAAKRLIREPD